MLLKIGLSIVPIVTGDDGWDNDSWMGELTVAALASRNAGEPGLSQVLDELSNFSWHMFQYAQWKMLCNKKLPKRRFFGRIQAAGEALVKAHQAKIAFTSSASNSRHSPSSRSSGIVRPPMEIRFRLST